MGAIFFSGVETIEGDRSWGKKVEIKDRIAGTRIFESDNPFEVIKKEIKAYRPVDVPGLPRFFGGLVGYIGYDTVRFFERHAR